MAELSVPTADELAAAIAHVAANNATTVPDRNAAPLPTSSNASSNALDQTNSSSQTSQSEVVQNSTSNSSSDQLPAGSGADTTGTGIAAASTTSSTNAATYAQTANTNLGIGDASYAPLVTYGAASPVDQSTLQSSSNVYNNAYGTTSNQGSSTISSGNQRSQNADPYDRVKLRFKSGHPFASYPGILNPLLQTNGLVWLFKPSVQLKIYMFFYILLKFVSLSFYVPK